MINHNFDNERLAYRAINHSAFIIENPVQKSLDRLEALSKEVEQQLSLLIKDENPEQHEQNRRQSLFNTFYKLHGFKGDPNRYYQPESVVIAQVLKSKRGGPIALGILLLHLAHQFKIQLDGVNFPSHFLLRYCVDGQNVYFDPFSQEMLNHHLLQARLKGVGISENLRAEKHLKILDYDGIIKQHLMLEKAAFIRVSEYLNALRCNEQLLLIDPDDPYEIRDRGFLFEQLECPKIAASDYEYFLSQCPNDPVVPILKLQMQALEAIESVLH